MADYTPIAESNNFIVLDHYTKVPKTGEGYQKDIDAIVAEIEGEGVEA